MRTTLAIKEELLEEVKSLSLIIAAAAYKMARLLHSDSDFETLSSAIDLEEEKVSKH